METFPFIKNCLLTYNYPLVHSMNEEEVSDIFKSSNRCFLISWMLKLLDSTYEEVLENSENDKELLSNCVYELGFCTKKDKLSFIKGELPVSDQVKIIFNIFKFIVDIKEINKQDNTVVISNDELISLANMDLNLFPMYGDIKLLNPSEKNLKLSELEKEIHAINVDLTTTKDMGLLDNNFKEDIQEFIEQLKSDFLEIESVIENINVNKGMDSQNSIELKSGSVETIKKCRENVKVISQFIADINTIEDFEKQNFSELKENRSSDTYNMIKALYQEVLSVLKNNKYI